MEPEIQQAAPAGIVDAASLPGIGGGDEITILGMFMQADIVVQSVMLLLLLASVWVWAVFFSKYGVLRRTRTSLIQFEDKFWHSESLDGLYESTQKSPDHPVARMFIAGMREWYQSRNQNGRQGAQPDENRLQISLKERLLQTMMVLRSREMEALEHHVGFLATIGSTAPFVGLFGTVWGIMNSFTAIAATKNTSLDVVAPGIAEALLATAIGLLAAIPAVVIYNKLSTEIDRIDRMLEEFSQQMVLVMERQFGRQETR